MKTRREFLSSLAVAGAIGATGLPVSHSQAQPVSPGVEGSQARKYWLSVLQRLSNPILENLSKRELKKVMPVEAANPTDRRRYTHLEALGRLLAGISPWLELREINGAEENEQRRLIDLTYQSIDAATDPKSPDFLNFGNGGQALVDSAFLAQAVLRAPRVLWDSLDSRLRRQLVQALKASRSIGTPMDSNWVMFAASVEAALLQFGESTIEERLEGSVRRMLGWYKGDGAYGDGQFFHFDYYNSFVIHPMLVDVLAVLKQKDARFEPAYAEHLRRGRRYAEVQERLIAPDGTFPPLGRSITYRFGALQSLAQISLLGQLPESVKPAQVRSAMTTVIQRMIEAPGTFDENGWLRIGFCGHQPALAEGYISTGSLYLCSLALLPLGLAPTDSFWNDPPVPWTSAKVWSGKDERADHAIRDSAATLEIPALKRTSAGTGS
jgi:hypothetical protein